MNEANNPGQAAPPLMVNIPLKPEHAQLIINLLGQRPHDEVRTLIDHIANTANQQIAEANQRDMVDALNQMPVDQSSGAADAEVGK